MGLCADMSKQWKLMLAVGLVLAATSAVRRRG